MFEGQIVGAITALVTTMSDNVRFALTLVVITRYNTALVAIGAQSACITAAVVGAISRRSTSRISAETARASFAMITFCVVAAVLVLMENIKLISSRMKTIKIE